MFSCKSSRLTSVIAAVFITDLYAPILPVILPLLIESMDLSYFLAGLIVTVFNILPSVLQPFVGFVNDTSKKHMNIAVCVILVAAGVSFSAIAGNYGILICLVAAAAVGNALFHPAGMDLVYKNSPPEKLGFYNSIYTTAGNIGYAAGPLAAGALITFAGLPAVSWLVIVGIAGACWIWMRAKKAGAQSQGLQADSARALPVEGNKTAAALVISACSLRAIGYLGIIAYLPTYLLQTQEGMTTFTASLAAAVMLFCGVAGQMTGGIAGDKSNRKILLSVGLSAAVPAFLLIFCGNTCLMYAGLMIYAFFASFCYVTSVTMTQELMTGKTGFASGMVRGFTYGFGGLAATGVGLIADVTGNLGDALFLLIIPVAVAPLLSFFVRYKKTADRVL